MTDIKALIAKLEAAPEGSRELDDAIMLAVGAEAIPHIETDDDEHFEVYESCHYTTSIDAKLPDERIRFSMLLAGGRHEAEAIDAAGNYHLAVAATEPLARRSAALKAREAA